MKTDSTAVFDLLARRTLALLLVCFAAMTWRPARAADASSATSLSLYARPQQLVELREGRRISVYCFGKGSPTVVLTASLLGRAVDWAAVQQHLSRRVRSCAWDRAGSGLSDSASSPQNALQSTADLRQTLQKGGLAGPYILVGYAAGSFETLLLADQLASQVQAMVLVEPLVPQQAFRLRSGSAEYADAYIASAARASAQLKKCAAQVARSGTPANNREADSCADLPASYPQDLRDVLFRLDADAARFLTRASSLDELNHSEQQVANAARHYGNIPVVVLTAQDGPQIPGLMVPPLPEQRLAVDRQWRADHDRLASLSTDGTDILVPGLGNLAPERAPGVINSVIDEVLDEVAGPKSVH